MLKSSWIIELFLSLLCFSVVEVASAQTNVVYNNTAVRKLDGFGASSAWFNGIDAGWKTPNVQGLPAQDQATVYDKLFSLTQGAGLSMLRLRIPYNIEPSKGTFDFEAIGGAWSGMAPEIAYINEAQKRGVSNVWATPWTPPAWMKTPSNIVQGELDTNHYDDYAEYLHQYYQYLIGKGITLSGISIQNEPEYAASYESCLWSDVQFEAFMPHLPMRFGADRPAFMFPEDGNWAESMKRSLATFNDAATAQIPSVYASHDYDHQYTPVSFPPGIHPKIWETETSTFTPNDPSISDGIYWAKDVHSALTIGGVNAWHYWWGYKQADSSTGNADNEALILYDVHNSTMTINKRLYTIGNYARFVRPGFNLMSLSTNTPQGGVSLTAFANPVSGEVVLVAINENSTSVQMTTNYLPVGVASEYRTSATENLANLGTFAVTNGTIPISLDPHSVTTYDGYYATGPANGTYKLMNEGTGLLMGIAGASKRLVAPAVEYSDNGSLDQRWTFTKLADGNYRITNVNSNLVLGVASGSKDASASLVQYTSDGTPNQEWIINATPNHCWNIVNAGSRMKMAWMGDSASLNTPAIQAPENTTTNQLWLLQ